MVEEKEVQRRIGAIEGRIREIESCADSGLKAAVRDLVQSLMDLHAAGLERIVGIVSGDCGVMEQFTRDELVNSLLLLYGLHPVPFEERVRGALEKVRPYLQSHGAEADLLGVEEGVIRLRLQGSGCVKAAIEDAIGDAAPDLNGLVMEEPLSAFVPLEALQGCDHGR